MSTDPSLLARFSYNITPLLLTVFYMTDSLTISSLLIKTRIGVHAWEQRILQRLLVDIDIPADFHACSDDLTKTIDYETLCQRITAIVESSSFQLIETVAETVAALIKNEFAINRVTVKVSKPDAIKNAGNVQVSITR